MKTRLMSLAELDARLDVSVDEWDRAVRRLVRELRARPTRLDVPEAISLDQLIDPTVAWSRLYLRQVSRLPRMERAEEFAMARRHEFVVARLRDALERAGVEDPDSAIKSGAPVATRGKRSVLAHLERCRADYEALRNLFVEKSLHLVFQKVHRYRGLGVDELDLIQEASASLFQAIAGFDWRRDVRFHTYASYWIHQAILKTLYDASRTVRLPVWIQKAHRKIQRAREAYRHEHGDWPPVEVVAERLDMEAGRVEEILSVRRGAVSLDKPVFDDGGSLSQHVADEHTAPIEERARDGDLRASLDVALSDLPSRERTIIERRFGLTGAEPETLASIAVDLEVTPERVRQLQNGALERLRRSDAHQLLKSFV